MASATAAASAASEERALDEARHAAVLTRLASQHAAELAAAEERRATVEEAHVHAMQQLRSSLDAEKVVLETAAASTIEAERRRVEAAHNDQLERVASEHAAAIAAAVASAEAQCDTRGAEIVRQRVAECDEARAAAERHEARAHAERVRAERLARALADETHALEAERAAGRAARALPTTGRAELCLKLCVCARGL